VFKKSPSAQDLNRMNLDGGNNSMIEKMKMAAVNIDVYIDKTNGSFSPEKPSSKGHK